MGPAGVIATLDTAYESVPYLTYPRTMGWCIRGLHDWSAGIMVVMLFFHLFRLILVPGYQTPREGTGGHRRGDGGRADTTR